MKAITSDVRLIAACGLYCGACRKYLSGKCPGCRDNVAASWCKIRKCVAAKNFRTCAECGMDVDGCRIYSNFIAKLFGLIFRSDRPACIRFIKEHGERAYADEMAGLKCQTIKKK